MQQSTSSEANGRSVSQKITANLFSSPQEPPFAAVLRQTTQSQSNHFISLKFISILPSHLRVVFPSSLFPSAYTTTTLYAFISLLVVRRNGIVPRCGQGSVTDVTSHSTLDVNVLGSPR